MAKNNKDRVSEKPVARLSMHQGHKFDHAEGALEREPIRYQPSPDAGINHERLPERSDLKSMELAYREQPISDADLLVQSDRQLSRAMFMAIACSWLFMMILPALPWTALVGVASLGTFYAVLGQYRRSAFSIQNFFYALLIPLLGLVAVKSFSFFIIKPTIFAVVMGIVTVILYDHYGRAPFLFYRDWLLTEPRLKPSTRHAQSFSAVQPALLVLLSLLTLAAFVPLVSNWLAMVAVAAASVVWIAGNAVRLSWSATQKELSRILQAMREVFAQYVMYGQWATRAPGVWYPDQSCATRRRTVVALCALPTLTLSIAFSGFVPWDLPIVSGRFKKVCVEQIASRTDILLMLRELTPSIDWEAYPELSEVQMPDRLPEATVKKIKKIARNYTAEERLYRKAWEQLESELAEKQDATNNRKVWKFFKGALGNSAHFPAIVAVIGLMHGEGIFLWILATAIALAAVLSVLVIVATFTPTVRAISKFREKVDSLDIDDRCEWQWYVDRVRSSPHTATEPLGIPVRERNHLFLGVEPEADFPVLLDRSILAEHAHLVGDSGSGKTSLGLMPLLMQLLRGDTSGQGDSSDVEPPPPMVILDLKGDQALFNMMRHEAEQRSPGNPDAFLYFTPEQGLDSCYFNPFASLITERRSTLQLCQILLDSLSLNHGEGYGRSYYTRRIRKTLFDALIREPQPRSMEELGHRLEAMVRQNETEDVFELLATVEALTQYPQLAVREPSLPTDRVIHMPTVLEKHQVVYFWLPSALESVSVREIGKLALFSLLTAAIDRQRDGLPVRQSYLVIDEFQRLASENFKIILEQSRSFGIAAILANQTRSDLQLHDVDLRPTINTNTRFKQFFSVSDLEEINDLSELSGEELGKMTGYSLTTGDETSSETISFNDSIKPKLIRNDILRISDHPLDSVVRISRGSGYTQFGGACIHLRSTWPVTKSDYDKLAIEPWPSSPAEDSSEEEEPTGVVVSDHSPADIDREAAREAARMREEAMKKVFEKYDNPSPTEKDS